MNTKEYIASGVIENFVLGLASAEEVAQLKQLCLQYPELNEEIDRAEEIIMKYAESHTNSPDPTVKAFLMATIDYTERMKKGEQPGFPPLLNEKSRTEDYNEWLTRNDMLLAEDFEELHAKIIGYTPAAITAIVWIKSMAPQEVHTDEFEKFLIVEGTCDIIIGEEVHHLAAGDYLSIPLHVHHKVIVTSKIPCKLILQRIAA